jgi:hypothetical protein
MHTNCGVHLNCTVFYSLSYYIIGNIMRHYDTLQELDATFEFFWKSPVIHQEGIPEQMNAFLERYYVSEDMMDEFKHIKKVLSLNLGQKPVPHFNY